MKTTGNTGTEAAYSRAAAFRFGTASSAAIAPWDRGGISAETIDVANSEITANNTGYEHSGGGLFGLFVTIDRSSITENSAAGGGGGGVGTWFSATETGRMRVTNSIVSDNATSFGGGGLRGVEVYVADSIVSRNDGGDWGDGSKGVGGGIRGSTVAVVRSTVSDNAGRGDGGGSTAFPLSCLKTARSAATPWLTTLLAPTVEASSAVAPSP